MFWEYLRDLFSNYPQVVWGISEVREGHYFPEYNRAIVFAVPHRQIMTHDNYKEELLEKLILQSREVIDSIVSELESILSQHEIAYLVPPVAQNPNDGKLAAPFSFKYAAVKSGLGWIGKNDLLITEQYGPRVRLGAVLVNDQTLPFCKEIIKVKCT